MRKILALLTLLALGLAVARGQQIHRNDFGYQVQWLKGSSNANFRELEHKTTDEYAHKGGTSEAIAIEAELGPNNAAPFVHYVYPTPQAPVSPQLSASVWVRAKQPGIQMRARLVLPRVENRQRPGEMFTTFLDGDFYKYTDNWQKLEFKDFPKLLADKQQSLRIELGREVDLTGAFIDQMVLNLYAGPGRTQLWIDELEIGPVPDDRAATNNPRATTTPTPNGNLPRPARGGLVEINRDQLKIDGKRFLPRMIRLTDTPLEALKRAGFNTLVLDASVSPMTIDEAVQREFYLVPSLPITDLDPRIPGFNVSLPGGDDHGDSLSRYLSGDRVLFWYLGGGRSSENLEKVALTAQAIRESDPQRPLGVDARDGLWPYSRNVDLLGVHRWPLFTSLELSKYKDWLDERRRLARPGTFTWTWVQTHLPEWYTHLVYDREPTAVFDEPIGPQPEQIRLLTYIALANGCKGIGYWSDRFLGDSHQGRDRLLSVALLNLEMEMLEPVLLSLIRGPTWIDTSNPNVKAAVLQGEKGILVLPLFIGGGGQYVPGQSAERDLTLTVPMVPDSMIPYEVSPAEVRSLMFKRIRGGSQITIHDFSLTSTIVFTGDVSGLLVYFQEECRKAGPAAAQFACDLARAEADKVRKVHEQLERVAPPISGANDLLRDTDDRIAIATAYLNRQDYRSAYLEATRALRPLRRMMRLEWDQAVKPLNGTPTASPFAVCYYTLPKQYAMQESIRRSVPGTNALAGGSFEGQPDPTWSIQQKTLDDVLMSVRLSSQTAHEGRQCLELSVVPKPIPPQPGQTQPPPVKPPEALEHTFVAVTSPSVHLTPGTLVRISGWVRVPVPIKASADGVLFYENIGGDQLAVRLTERMDWKQFTLYRTVPASGEVSVTMALTGLGTAQFDDVRIEPMLPVTGGATVLQK